MAQMELTKGRDITPDRQNSPHFSSQRPPLLPTTISRIVRKPPWSIRAQVAVARHVVNVGSR
jgi:hypothetical protein